MVSVTEPNDAVKRRNDQTDQRMSTGPPCKSQPSDLWLVETPLSLVRIDLSLTAYGKLRND